MSPWGSDCIFTAPSMDAVPGVQSLRIPSGPRRGSVLAACRPRSSRRQAARARSKPVAVEVLLPAHRIARSRRSGGSRRRLTTSGWCSKNGRTTSSELGAASRRRTSHTLLFGPLVGRARSRRSATSASSTARCAHVLVHLEDGVELPSAASPHVRIPVDRDGEATFSVDEPDDPARIELELDLTVSC